MHRTVFLAFLLTALPLASFAQDADLESVELPSDFDEEIDLIDEFTMLQEDAFVELAARHKQEIGMSPSAVSVITRDDIEASGATSITDLLRIVPGMEVVIATPYFSSISSRLMWTYENNIYLVLVDGREANVELLGFTPFEIQPVSLNDIQRIEIIRGPGSSLYGANAVAGVVRRHDNVTVAGHVVAPEGVLGSYTAVPVRENDQRKHAVPHARVSHGEILERRVYVFQLDLERKCHHPVQLFIRALQKEIGELVLRQVARILGCGVPYFSHERARTFSRYVGAAVVHQ